MTPPDRAPEPLSAEEEADLRSRTVSVLWKRTWATLDAARDSRPGGGHTWAEHVACDPATCTVAHLARDSRPGGEGPHTGGNVCIECGGGECCGGFCGLHQAGPAAVRPVERELDVERLYLLSRLVLIARDEMPERLNNRTRVNLSHAAAVADPLTGHSCGECDRILAARLSTTQPASTEAGDQGELTGEKEG